MSIRANAQHGIVCALNTPPENYFGWPSAARLEDGAIVAGCSGLRRAHICPYGKSVLFFSRDGGKTFGAPVVAHDDLIDNRDLGIVPLGGQRFAITWFSLDMRKWHPEKSLPESDAREAAAYMAGWRDEAVQRLVGSWIKITQDGGQSWGSPIRVPVSAPHGFIRLKSGSFGYLGKGFHEGLDAPTGPVQYAQSDDGGLSWRVLGQVPLSPVEAKAYHEPHVIELASGRLMGAIRYHIQRKDGYGLDTCLSFSEDGGKSWSTPERLHISGSPPHLLRHSSGAIVLSYGYREKGYGQRAIISRDEGRTWSDEIILRDDGESADLGYPCTLETDDGSLLTVYYQALPGRKNTSILSSHWRLEGLA